MSELFKAGWKYDKKAEKKDKAAYIAGVGATGAASGVGGYKMGNEIGREKVLGGNTWRNAAKTASKTKGFKVGAGLAAAGIGGSALVEHKAKKDKVLVKKDADLFTATWQDKVIKKMGPMNSGAISRVARKGKLKSLMEPYKGGIQQTTKSGVSGRQAAKKQKLVDLTSSYKGSNPRPASGGLRQIGLYGGGVPRNSSSFKLSDRLKRG